MKKALIAMSGGVDSSVAALLVKNAGVECIGCTMKLHGGEATDPAGQKTCCTAEDAADARSVASRLGFPFYVFNFEDDFRKNVIRRFCNAYLSGATPNPCIDCNRYMKFGKLFERADLLGCDTVVTGHYARVVRENGRYLLKTAADPKKDQSYVLYTLTQAQLARVAFPLGELSKETVRRLAAEHGFLNADKPESQDICFAPDGDYAAVIERETGKISAPGDFIDTNGAVLGRHRGVIRYTVGQRRGLGIAAKESYYVKSVDPAANTVTLCFREGLMSDTCVLHDINLIAFSRIEGTLEAAVRIRYRHPAAPALVSQPEDDTLLIRFKEPQRAITRGQAAVIYLGDTVVGGGTIAAACR